MPRWRILRTLLYKEVLRYRYNWGLLVVVAALIALAVLISLGGDNELLSGSSAAFARDLKVYCQRESLWGIYLQENRLADRRVRFWPPRKTVANPRLERGVVVVELFAPGETPMGESQAVTVHTARFWHLENDTASLVVFQDWLDRETRKFLAREPVLEVEHRGVRNSATDIIPLVITGLVAFALYLPAFNLFITSTGEEREKRLLLALLLTPARPLEIVLAKAIFYALGSLAVSLAVVALHEPMLVFEPRLVLAVLLGSIGYVAIGTVLISFIRRQTTLSTVSMLYLMGVGVVVSLAQTLPLFNALRLFLIENFLYSLLQKVLAGEPSTMEQVLGLVALGVLVAGWLTLAVVVFSRRSKQIAQAR
jgi:hypothetical protein